MLISLRGDGVFLKASQVTMAYGVGLITAGYTGKEKDVFDKVRF
jgi:hypothetical protein